MKHSTTFTCVQCGETKVHVSEISTGYGVNKDGQKVCFACCGLQDAKDLETMAPGKKMCLYLNTKDKTISNWPGSFKINLHYIKEGRHNMAGKRFDTWFKYAGANFHGVQYGNNTQIIHIKKIN